jgi:putative sigma-54 modulation protein
MKTTVTGRHIEVTPALKAYVEERINHLGRYSNRATEASVILTVEKYRHQADVTVNVNGTVVQATEETSEMYSSIDQAVEKVERQIKKLKDRLHDHRQRVEPLPVDEAVAGAPVLGRTVVAERPAVAAMTPEDAASSLERGSDSFLLFRHAATAQVNLVYHKADGTVGWIDPNP